MAKPRPAFSKQFQPRPYPNPNRLFLGWTGFRLASSSVKSGRNDLLAIHPDTMPNELDWTLLRGLSVMIYEHEDMGQDYRHQLIDELVLAGARDGILIPANNQWNDEACGFGITRQVSA